jgi:iron-sulfur cluster assembly protein
MTDSAVRQHQSADKQAALQLQCTTAAIDYIRRYLAKHPSSQGIRIGVEQRGCSGFAYVIEPNQAVTDNDLTVIIAEGVQAVIDAQYVPMLSGTTLDLEKQGLNEKLVFQNPNASGTCGCGESFTFDA